MSAFTLTIPANTSLGIVKLRERKTNDEKIKISISSTIKIPSNKHYMSCPAYTFHFDCKFKIMNRK